MVRDGPVIEVISPDGELEIVAAFPLRVDEKSRKTNSA
jgi:hypothetical protein